MSLFERQYSSILDRVDTFEAALTPEQCFERLSREVSADGSTFANVKSSKTLAGHVQTGSATVSPMTDFYQISYLDVHWSSAGPPTAISCQTRLSAYGKSQIAVPWMFAGLYWAAILFGTFGSDEIVGRLSLEDYVIIALQNVVVLGILWGSFRYFRGKLTRVHNSAVTIVRRVLGA